MGIFRLLLGTIYDTGRLMSALSILAGITYLTRGLFIDSPTDGTTGVTYFALSIAFWAIARIFRRYAV